MELTTGMKQLLKKVAPEQDSNKETYYGVLRKLDVIESMIQSSEKSGKVPSNKHYIDLEEKGTDFAEFFHG